MENTALGAILYERDKLLPTILHALRHDPWKYGLDLDEHGWTSAEALLSALRFDRLCWESLRWGDLEAVVGMAGEDRVQIQDGRIRAVYGHSVFLKQLHVLANPPKILFHGTAAAFLPKIFRRGLRPIGRQFVHLTADPKYANEISATKPDGVVLLVQASQAHAHGVWFRKANAHVWLTKRVPPSYIEVQERVVSMGRTENSIALGESK